MLLTVLMVLGVLAVLFAAAALATHDRDLLLDAPPDRADVDLPPVGLQPEEISSVRFGMAVRGYRMSEVDDVLARVASELQSKDARILELEGALIEVVEPQVTAAEAFAEDPLVVEASAPPAVPRWPEPELEPEPEPEPIVERIAEAAALERPIPELPEPEQPEPEQSEPEQPEPEQPEPEQPEPEQPEPEQPEPEQPRPEQPRPEQTHASPPVAHAITSINVTHHGTYVPVGHPDSHHAARPPAVPEPIAVPDPSGGEVEDAPRD